METQRSKTITSENAFSSPKGLPYFSDMAFNRMMEEEANVNGDEIEMHIDEEMQAQVMKSIDKVVNNNQCDEDEEEDYLFNQSLGQDVKNVK